MTVDSNVGIGLHGEKTRKWVLRALEPSGQHNTGIAQYVDTSEKPAFDVTIESHDIHNRRVVTRHTMDVDGCLYMEVNGKILVGKKP
ncbi:MAG: hypothetical protein Q7T82_01625 [Armatimonadota bacterium]|nr:hypothetical protein [Armatimonadota bacterium]